MGRTRRALVTVIAAATLLTAGCSEATRDESGKIEEEGDLDVFSFRLGDCFSSGTVSDAPDGEVYEVGGVTGVPCEQPHSNEVFHLFDVADGEYPGSDELQSQAGEACLGEFEAYVGAPYQTSVLDIGAIWPTPETWAQDDREIVCYLYHVDGEDLEGSMQGAGI